MVTLEVPRDWIGTSVPGVALATVQPGEGVPVTSNVIVRTLTVAASTTSEDLVGELRASVAGRLDGGVSELGTVPLGGTDITLVQLAWTTPEGPGMLQLHAMALVPRPDGLLDYVNVTGTADRDDDAAYAEVDAVVRSLHLQR